MEKPGKAAFSLLWNGLYKTPAASAEAKNWIQIKVKQSKAGMAFRTYYIKSKR